MQGSPRTNSAISSDIYDPTANGFWQRGMTTLEIDVGDLQARVVEFTATELVVTLVDGLSLIHI